MAFSSPSLPLCHKACSSSSSLFPSSREMRLSLKMPSSFHPLQQLSLSRAQRCRCTTPRFRAGGRPRPPKYDAVGHVDGLVEPVGEAGKGWYAKAAMWQTKHKVFQLESEDLYFRRHAVGKLWSVFGFYFSPPDLAWLALTHRSYYDHLNGKLSEEYDSLVLMGDSLLKLLAAGELVVSEPKLCDRHIFYISAKDIDPMKLACCVVDHGLHYYLRHKEHGLMDEIHNFVKSMHENDELLSPPDVLPQIVHAIIGAVYLNSLAIDPMVDVEMAFDMFINNSASDEEDDENEWPYNLPADWLLVGH